MYGRPSSPVPHQLKALFRILLLPISGLWAQPGPPDLRCLEVLSSGNVKLHWIPAQDPSGQFFSYEIYASSRPASGYTLAGTVGALATGTFVHINAGANGTSAYYFMRTRYGSGGTDISAHTDTLRSIFLNIIPAAIDLKLVYNGLKQPKLPSSSSTFTLQKEYPLGTWNILGTSQTFNYSDTLTVCGDSMSYLVQLPDNMGCISQSNRQKGKYFDQKPPNEPYVDSISVLPNGQTILAWRIPWDKDVSQYVIYRNTGITNTVDIVTSGNSTSYVYTDHRQQHQPATLCSRRGQLQEHQHF